MHACEDPASRISLVAARLGRAVLLWRWVRPSVGMLPFALANPGDTPTSAGIDNLEALHALCRGEPSQRHHSGTGQVGPGTTHRAPR